MVRGCMNSFDQSCFSSQTNKQVLKHRTQGTDTKILYDVLQLLYTELEKNTQIILMRAQCSTGVRSTIFNSFGKQTTN